MGGGGVAALQLVDGDFLDLSRSLHIMKVCGVPS